MIDKNSNKLNKRVISLENEIAELTTQLQAANNEIKIEKALELVRKKALEMRSSSQLPDTSAVLFQQLRDLSINVISSGVGIFDKENDAIELWTTSLSKNQKLEFILDYVNIHVHSVFENIIRSSNNNESHALTVLSGIDLRSYHETMLTYIKNPTLIPGKNLTEFYYSFFFNDGALNLVTNQLLTAEEQKIVHRLADVFGLLYTRFLDLSKAEKLAGIIEQEKKILQQTLDGLKATQSQLIQSEKMASLGELTAGIAHEIQNPLNFVNNFSDVNGELIDELVEEINEGNFDEVKELAKDIKSNEEKIKHHGSRADSIVKGMLQHSRTNSGEKTPTDINAICDEYLRLAYHGLRAKNIDFNAKMDTDFDESIGSINVVAQDISRVILNLITNAFQACASRSDSTSGDRSVSALSAEALAKAGQDYQPLVSITTKQLNNLTTITVKDNGSGIPDAIKDKIFQPFFTTKATGQGTGLGLSLAYDIVKAHGGELRVESEEGEGAAFSITLPI